MHAFFFSRREYKTDPFYDTFKYTNPPKGKPGGKPLISRFHMAGIICVFALFVVGSAYEIW